MRTQKEKKYLKKYWNDMQMHLHDFLQSRDQEALHRFRVQVKKTKAFLFLMEQGSGKKKMLRLFKPVKKIFKQAGVIREAHIHLQLSDRFQLHNEAFKKQQHRIVRQGTEKFCSKSGKYLHGLRKTNAKLQKASCPVKNEKIRDFYKQTLDEITRFLANPVFDDRLHDCRKQIKYLLYNLKPAAAALNSMPALDKHYLEKVQEMIGRWHDNLLAIELFSSTQSEDASLNSELRTQNNDLQKKITAYVAHFGTKAAE